VVFENRVESEGAEFGSKIDARSTGQGSAAYGTTTKSIGNATGQDLQSVAC
jgi:hypothetical protein